MIVPRANVKPTVIREIVKTTRNQREIDEQLDPTLLSLLKCSCLFTRSDLGSNLSLQPPSTMLKKAKTATWDYNKLHSSGTSTN